MNDGLGVADISLAAEREPAAPNPGLTKNRNDVNRIPKIGAEMKISRMKSENRDRSKTGVIGAVPA